VLAVVVTVALAYRVIRALQTQAVAVVAVDTPAVLETKKAAVLAAAVLLLLSMQTHGHLVLGLV
jgi:NAD(P)H-hydrate repair Nnr-like enzyme with NAD(P)H-hydrate epimerase domain